MQRTIQQNKQLHTLLSKLNIDKETKAILIHQYTEQRTVNSSEMDVYECQNLINHLRKMLNQNYITAPKLERSNNDELLDKQRKRLIAKFREMGFDTEDNKADMKRINETIFKHWHKGINQFNKEELNKIIAVVEHKWLPNFYKNQTK